MWVWTYIKDNQKTIYIYGWLRSLFRPQNLDIYLNIKLCTNINMTICQYKLTNIYLRSISIRKTTLILIRLMNRNLKRPYICIRPSITIARGNRRGQSLFESYKDDQVVFLVIVWWTPFGLCSITGLEACDGQIQHSNGRQMNTYWRNWRKPSLIYCLGCNLLENDVLNRGVHKENNP